VFFFASRRRHTRSKRDWSSDVCSSDLTIGEETVHFPLHHDRTQAASIRQHLTQIQPAGERSFAVQLKEASLKFGSGFVLMIVTKIGRASCREGEYSGAGTASVREIQQV